MKARWADPAKRARQRAAIANPVSLAKLRAASKARWADSEMREKMLTGIKTTTKRLGRPPALSDKQDQAAGSARPKVPKGPVRER